MCSAIYSNQKIKDEILSALSHPEAQDGLYFWNLGHVSEMDLRPRVRADDDDIYLALLELLRDEEVIMESGENEAVFRLNPHIADRPDYAQARG